MDAEKDRRDITNAVGECLMTWAMVERNICILYCLSIECCERKTLNPGLHAYVFDSVISLDARMEMIKCVFRAMLSIKASENSTSPYESFFDQWDSLAKKIRKKYKKRNEVAHSDIVQSVDGDGVKVFRLAPFATMTSPLTNRLSVKELIERKDSFWTLAREIVSFIDQVRAAQATLPAIP